MSPTGSSLPAIPELYKTFNVSRAAIHGALIFLKEENYISLIQGHSAIATYNVLLWKI
nr:GntR family transcriptional regulator [Hungatella hathewayi]